MSITAFLSKFTHSLCKLGTFDHVNNLPLVFWKCLAYSNSEYIYSKICDIGSNWQCQYFIYNASFEQFVNSKGAFSKKGFCLALFNNWVIDFFMKKAIKRNNYRPILNIVWFEFSIKILFGLANERHCVVLAYLQNWPLIDLLLPF